MSQTDQIAGTPPSQTAAAVPGPRAGGSRVGNKGALLVIACVAQFMVVLDVSIVNVALPAMRGALDLSPTGVQWVVNAYALGFAGLLLFGGRAADLFGAKPVFLTGLVGFTAASLAGGMANTGTLLIAARSVQGLAGAVLAPATMTLIMTTFTDPRERTKALGAWSATMAAGGAMGAVVGGMLTQWVSWRWVLFVNVPIGVVLLLAAVPLIAKTRGRGATLRTLDLPGAITVTLGLTGIVYGVVTTDTHGWGSSTVLVPIVAGAVLLALFVLLEARSKHALVPLRVFRNRSLAVADLAALLIGAGMFAMWFYVSLYLQQVLGFDALQAGFAFVPGSAMIVLGTMLATRILPRIGPRPLLLVGPLVAAVGLAWLARFPADGSYTADVLGPLMLLTFGMGLAMTPLAVAGTAGMPRHEAGLASGLINTSRQVGGAIGLAALSTISAHIAATHGGGPKVAMAAGFSGAMIGAAIALAAAGIVAALLPGRASEAAQG
ncbi:MFS transporter [Catenulispora sp. NF23]|uniref:MFS transporter n=1 Tax=Catenulispora pinistramenti TaxID=2705254 RepID=A0ABS5L814_9ACTN|nr:MFS transporter [Catenulispora pinistramenti]MBS2539720.1 MFS transporter [Catenulispora pinistramenti]MBS2554487.1 MFS transporter [Catenulispora pinistramenti]